MPIIAMSGYAFANAERAPDFLRMTIELGAACCLRKPFTPDALLTSVNQCITTPASARHSKCEVSNWQCPRSVSSLELASLSSSLSAPSIGLDLKSRSDNATVDRALGILSKISDMRPLLRRASAARAFALTGDQQFATEYARPATRSAGARGTDRSRQGQSHRKAVDRRDQGAGGAPDCGQWRVDRTPDRGRQRRRRSTRQPGRPRGDGRDRRKPRKGGGGRAQLLFARRRIETNGTFLLAIDLAGVALILILATVLTLSTRRSRRELQDSLSATQATNEALEAAVAERTEHLVAAHDELGLSAAVLRSTFHSMAEAVLVIDPREILLSNPAAEKMLRYRPGMTVELLRSLSTVFHADGVTPLLVRDMPASRALRGEAFDATEIVVRPVSGNPPVHLMISGRPLRDGSGAISGAALVYHDATASRETEHKLLQSQKLDAIGKLTGGVAHDSTTC